MNTTLRGRRGEAETADYLRKRGYEVVGANFRTRFGEVDLIARKDGILAFVEVKLRKDAAFAEAREFVTPAKQRRVRAAAEEYLARRDWEGLQPRFDVAEVYAAGSGFDIRYYEDAF